LKQNSGSGTGPALAVLVLMLMVTSIARTPYLQFVHSGSKTSEQEGKAVMPAQEEEFQLHTRNGQREASNT
jgi:hypothetical protein